MLLLCLLGGLARGMGGGGAVGTVWRFLSLPQEKMWQAIYLFLNSWRSLLRMGHGNGNNGLELKRAVSCSSWWLDTTV